MFTIINPFALMIVVFPTLDSLVFHSLIFLFINIGFRYDFHQSRVYTKHLFDDKRRPARFSHRESARLFPAVQGPGRSHHDKDLLTGSRPISISGPRQRQRRSSRRPASPTDPFRRCIQFRAQIRSAVCRACLPHTDTPHHTQEKPSSVDRCSQKPLRRQAASNFEHLVGQGHRITPIPTRETPPASQPTSRQPTSTSPWTRRGRWIRVRGCPGGRPPPAGRPPRRAAPARPPRAPPTPTRPPAPPRPRPRGRRRPPSCYRGRRARPRGTAATTLGAARTPTARARCASRASTPRGTWCARPRRAGSSGAPGTGGSSSVTAPRGRGRGRGRVRGPTPPSRRGRRRCGPRPSPGGRQGGRRPGAPRRGAAFGRTTGRCTPPLFLGSCSSCGSTRGSSRRPRPGGLGPSYRRKPWRGWGPMRASRLAAWNISCTSWSAGSASLLAVRGSPIAARETPSGDSTRFAILAVLALSHSFLIRGHR
jgi:hypothetical protein